MDAPPPYDATSSATPDAATIGTEYMDAVTIGTPYLLARREGPTGWIVFNNPARRNAVRLDMWAAMPRILHAFDADRSIRIIALAGAGPRAFISGADISQFEQQRNDPEAVARYDRISHAADAALKAATKPTAAVIHGWCIGGGVGVAVGCDLRFAADTATFGVPAARLGLGYGMAGVKTLMDLVGPAYTKEIFYTARHFSASEALAMGLVNRVLPEAELLAYARVQFAAIAANAPLTLHTLKRTVAALSEGRPTDDADIAARVTACFASNDYAEGRRAFMEKRPPAFTGT